MSGDVLYSDVTFVKKGKGPGSSNQEDVTYSEVRKATPEPTKVISHQDDDVTYSMVTIAPAQRKAGEKEEEATYSEVQTGSQPNSPPGKSNTKKRVAIGLLIFLLVLAIVLIVIGLYYGPLRNTSDASTETTTVPATTKQTTTTVPPCVVQCDAEWELNETKCYNFSSNKLKWTESRDMCRSLSADLVKIESREEQSFLFKKLKMNDWFWIGLTDSEIEGQWKWTDGSALDQSLTFWNKDPDNYDVINPDGEDCAIILLQPGQSVDTSWADINCKSPQRFICEKEPICK